MAGVWQTFDKNGKPHPKWKFWYKDWQGKKANGTGTDDKEETLEQALMLEEKDAKLRRRIHLGLCEAPTSAEIAKPRQVSEVIDEYLEQGNANGGRGGRPWGAGHARMRKTHLKFWREHLGLKTIADLSTGFYPRVEKTLRKLKSDGAAGKTVQNKSEAIHAFCLWAKKSGYLSVDPLDGLNRFDTTPQEKRGTLLSAQIPAVLNASCDHHRLLYEVAISTGLRVGELAALQVKHLDVKRCGLTLEASWTKNRKSGFQPLPRSLLTKLKTWVTSGRAQSLYTMHKEPRQRPYPDNPLLFVPGHPARELARDMDRAKVTAWGGKVDFHALRHTFVTLLHDAGASFAEARVLARHAAQGLTDGVYTHVRPERLQTLVEAVWIVIHPEEKLQTSFKRKVAGGENSIPDQVLNMVGAEGFEPSTSCTPSKRANPSCATPRQLGGNRCASGIRGDECLK